MDSKEQLGSRNLVVGLLKPNESFLCDVSVSTLNDVIIPHPTSGTSGAPKLFLVGGVRQSEILLPTQNRLGIPIGDSLMRIEIQPAFDARVSTEIVVENLLGFFHRDLEAVGKREGAQTVRDTKVDGLGLATEIPYLFVSMDLFLGKKVLEIYIRLILGLYLIVNPQVSVRVVENLLRSNDVQVLVVAKDGQELRILTNLGENTKFALTVIRGKDYISGGRLETITE